MKKNIMVIVILVLYCNVGCYSYYKKTCLSTECYSACYEEIRQCKKVGHKFMADPEWCTECHTVKPDIDDNYCDLSFVDTISELCHKCHTEEELGISHPINMQPSDKMNIPDDLHLDKYMNITCTTCHDPHGERYIKFYTKTMRTYYLRRTKMKNTLCIACHSDI